VLALTQQLNGMSQLGAETKHHILLEYSPDDPTRSFAALAERHEIAGGRQTVWLWHQRWDGTAESLERHSGSGRPRILSEEEVQQHVLEPVVAANRAHRPIHYPEVTAGIAAAAAAEPSPRTVRRYGHDECGIRDKHTIKRTEDECEYNRALRFASRCIVVALTLSEVSPVLCEQIASIRRKLQRIDKRRVLFLDESACRLSEADTHTLVAPGEMAYVIASETTAYSKRYDMIAVCNGERVLLPKIFTPGERAGAEARGINKAMLLQYIDDTLAQSAEGIDLYPLILIADLAPIHKDTDSILEAFHDRGSEAIKEVLLMPPCAAKRLSPLDNSLFHDWKEEVRRHCPLTEANIVQVMSDSLNRMDPAPHYHHCGLMRGTDVYFDCPDPHGHKHNA
jgi:hypothetical protein